MTIDPATSLGAVTLTVADLDAQAAFYRDAIGLREIRRDGDTVELGAPGGDAPLVTLVGRPDAPPRPPRTTGLFHLALLVPSRAELARSLHRVTRGRAPVHGRLRPSRLRGALPRRSRRATGSRSTATARARSGRYDDGQLQMATLPLDLDGVLASVARGRRRRRDGGRHADRPRPPPGRVDPRRRGVLRRCARLRADRARLSRARCSSRRAATTTTSGSTRGPARARRRRRRGARGLRSLHDRAPGRGGARRRRSRRAAAAGLEVGDDDGRACRRRSVRQPGRARRRAERVALDGGARLPLVLVRGVARAEVAQRHPERPVLHLPDVAELVGDEVVGDVVGRAGG